MSYFKIIADMRANYIEWLARRGEALPARLGRSGAGLPVSYQTVCADHAVIGDSEFAREALQELAARTGAGHFIVWMNMGNMPHALIMESMRQFVEEVMPHL